MQATTPTRPTHLPQFFFSFVLPSSSPTSEQRSRRKEKFEKDRVQKRESKSKLTTKYRKERKESSPNTHLCAYIFFCVWVSVLSILSPPTPPPIPYPTCIDRAEMKGSGREFERTSLFCFFFFFWVSDLFNVLCLSRFK
ncbi:hypothetical protein BKA57DRAFT_451462, partial [Linnemannia elongata]